MGCTHSGRGLILLKRTLVCCSFPPESALLFRVGCRWACGRFGSYWLIVSQCAHRLVGIVLCRSGAFGVKERTKPGKIENIDYFIITCRGCAKKINNHVYIIYLCIFDWFVGRVWCERWSFREKNEHLKNDEKNDEIKIQIYF